MEHTPILTPITGMDPGGGDGPTATGVLTMSGVIGTEPDAPGPTRSRKLDKGELYVEWEKFEVGIPEKI